MVISGRCEVFIKKHACACLLHTHTHMQTGPCVLRKRSLFPHCVRWNRLQLETLVCVCVCARTVVPFLCQCPRAKQNRAIPTYFFSGTVPLFARGHPSTRRARSSSTQRSSEPVSAGRPKRADGFHRNDSLLFLGPSHSFAAQWSSYEQGDSAD